MRTVSSNKSIVAKTHFGRKELYYFNGDKVIFKNHDLTSGMFSIVQYKI